MADKPFAQGIAELRELVGSGTISMQATVDQIYAQNQHESVWFRHPHGGQAKYLSTPLMEGCRRWLERVARDLLDIGPQEAMIAAANDLVAGVERYAPVDLNNLRRSGAARVTDDGRTIYDRAAEQSRLSAEELRRLGRSRHD
jgi:hypothetical protein